MENSPMNNTIKAKGEALKLTAYDELTERIKIAEQEDKKAAFDYDDRKQNKAARSYLSPLRTLRADIDRARKAAKAVAVDYGKRVDAAAKDLEARITAVIDRHDKPLKAVEQAEKDRKAKHEAVLEDLRGIITHTYSKSKHAYETLMDYENKDYSGLEEYEQDAIALHHEAMLHAKAEFDRLRKAEDEAAELEKLRQEKAEREMAERVAFQEKQAKERAEREAKQAKQAQADAERRAAEIEKREEERKKLEADRKREEAAEAARIRIERHSKAAEMREELTNAINDRIDDYFKAMDLAQAIIDRALPHVECTIPAVQHGSITTTQGGQA